MISMKVQINIDPEKLLKGWEEEANAAMEDLMMAAYNEWKDEAGRVFNTTRRVYQEAVQYQLIRPGTVHVFLQAADDRDNWLANALEVGYGKYNIWPAVLSGRGRTESRAAYYYSEKAKKPLKGAFKGGAPKTPFVDIPFRPGKVISPGMSKTKEQGRPDFYRRMSRGNIKGKWIHPGFQPRALSNHVVEYVKKTVPDIFGPFMARVTK